MVTPLGLYLKLRYLECRQHHDSPILSSEGPFSRAAHG